MPEVRRSIFHRLERGPLPEMRRFQAVDKVPGGVRFSFLKRVFARLLKLVSAPQAVYNYENLEAMQMMAREMDQLRERLRLLEDRPARPFGMAKMEGTEEKRLNTLVQQHLHHVQLNMEQLAGNIQDISRSLAQMVDNVSVVSGRMNKMSVKQRDVYTDISAARLDTSRLWTELGLVYESIDRRAEDIWHGMDERDSQLMTNTEAAQQLHNQVSLLETGSKELKARLLVLSEQLAMHQEMLENLQEDLTAHDDDMKTRPKRRPRPSDEESPERPQETAASHVPSDSSSAVPSLVQKQLDLAYLRFQRQYRGDEEELRKRQREYISLLSNHLNKNDEGKKPAVLDMACGDGIFLELLNEEGWTTQGVDINEAMVKQGRQRGLEIKLADALVYLENREVRDLDVVSAFQFVEHLPPSQLMRLLKNSYRALRPGGLLLLETINPHTLKALHWFHFDLTHHRLIFPEMLQLLAETVGFQMVEWKGVNPVAEDEKLQVEGSEKEKANLKKLNTLLYGEQDYYFLGRKPGGSPPSSSR